MRIAEVGEDLHSFEVIGIAIRYSLINMMIEVGTNGISGSVLSPRKLVSEVTQMSRN